MLGAQLRVPVKTRTGSAPIGVARNRAVSTPFGTTIASGPRAAASESEGTNTMS